MNVDQRNRILSIVLLLAILGLCYWLYASITGPWQEVQKERQMTEQVREQMLTINSAVRYFNEQHNSYPPSLDSLFTFLMQDSLFQVAADSILRNRTFDPDRFLYSVRTNNRFEYTLVDTVRPPLYKIDDPDTDDHVGTTTRVVDRGAPSWR